MWVVAKRETAITNRIVGVWEPSEGAERPLRLNAGGEASYGQDQPDQGMINQSEYDAKECAWN